MDCCASLELQGIIGTCHITSATKDNRQVGALAVVDAVVVLPRAINLEVVAREGVRTRIIHGVAALDVIVAGSGDAAAVVAGDFSTGNVNFVVGGSAGHHAAHGGENE